MASVRAEEKRLEARAVFSRLCEFVELLFRILDLRRRLRVNGQIVGRIDHALADINEVPPDRQIVDRTAIVLGVDDRGGVGCEPSKILGDG